MGLPCVRYGTCSIPRLDSHGAAHGHATPSGEECSVLTDEHMDMQCAGSAAGALSKCRSPRGGTHRGGRGWPHAPVSRSSARTAAERDEPSRHDRRVAELIVATRTNCDLSLEPMPESALSRSLRGQIGALGRRAICAARPCHLKMRLRAVKHVSRSSASWCGRVSPVALGLGGGVDGRPGPCGARRSCVL
jgi:hypothetical protein